jgi:uncharacterized protein YdeI (YjbR/CyaY-like superfamily)
VSPRKLTPGKKRVRVAPVRLFKDQKSWDVWLSKNHSKSSGVWLQLAKKSSGLKSVSRTGALETALCYGWIDGQGLPKDERTWLQRFIPRTEKSIWSKINREKCLGLIKSGRMQAPGLAAINRAKSNGRWEAAYDSPSRAAVPEDFEAALDANRGAKEFFNILDRANRYAILFRIQNVKRPETRARKILQFIGMLEKHEKIHP